MQLAQPLANRLGIAPRVALALPKLATAGRNR